MAYSSLLNLKNIDEYRAHYVREYCNQVITSHDGFIVKFEPAQFDHAFFKSRDRRARDKSLFSLERAQRMMWIKQVLADKSAEMHIGWDTAKKRYDPSYRVSFITPDDYVVIIRFTGAEKAAFVTAYLVDRPDVSQKIRNSPLWVPR
jgi:hypothetical protein